MKLEEMSMKSLLALHNAIASAPAGPKTFATKGGLITRIKAIAVTANIDLTSVVQPESVQTHKQPTGLRANIAVRSDAATETKRGRAGSVGELARRLLMDPAGYPHDLIASMVNAEISGATATSKSVRWYACEMRKAGVQVPERQKFRPC